MPKKRKIIIIAVVLAICIALIMSFFVGKTYARYLAQVNARGEGRIANWSFKVNGDENKMQTINLQSTLNNEKIKENKLAPGTSGQFEIKIDGTSSDVGIDYKVNVENEINKPNNLIFKFQEQSFNSMTQLAEKLTGTINANDENKVQILDIYWEWKYQTGTNEQEIQEKDIKDTEDAINASEYTFDLIVTGSQVENN